MLVKLERFFRRPGFVQLWFLPVWLGDGSTKLLILRFPFMRLVPRLSLSATLTTWLLLVELEQDQRTCTIGQVVCQAARLTPWVSNCFPQTVVGRVLLG